MVDAHNTCGWFAEAASWPSCTSWRLMKIVSITLRPTFAALLCMTIDEDANAPMPWSGRKQSLSKAAAVNEGKAP